MLEPLTRFTVVVLAGLCCSSAARGQESWDSPWSTPLEGRTAEGQRYVLDELLVTLEPGAVRQPVLQRLEALGASCLGEVPRLALLRVQLAGRADARSALMRFAAVEGVARVELNGLGEGGRVLLPDDPGFGSQWHHQNTLTNPGTPGADLESVAAWDLSTGSSDVTIAILDTGIDFTHPEFIGRTLPGYDFVNEDNDPTADHPHGIYVSGLAAANADNGLGTTGMDWQCQILPVKVLNQFNGGATFDLIQGLDYCAQLRPLVVSMSLVNYPGTGALIDALQAAREAGCILISCGANNAGANAEFSWPGASPVTITISASDSLDRRAGFSSWGPVIDFIAPGASVVTTSPSHANTSQSFSGCSGATPLAAGIVGLIAARHPLLSQSQAYEVLRRGAEDQVGPPQEDTPGYDPYFGHGRLNARAALAELDSDPSVIGYSCRPAALNSTGQAARLLARGSVVAAFDDLVLEVLGLPVAQFGYFLAGTGQGVVTPPGAAGQLCVSGGQLARLIPPVSSSGAAGTFSASIGTQGLPLIGNLQAGESWSFQAWYRDGADSNFSDALRVTFE